MSQGGSRFVISKEYRAVFRSQRSLDVCQQDKVLHGELPGLVTLLADVIIYMETHGQSGALIELEVLLLNQYSTFPKSVSGATSACSPP